MRPIEGRLLYKIGDSKGLLFKHLAFYRVDFESGKKEIIVRLPADWKKRILCRLRLVNRLLRMEPRCAGRLDKNRFIINVLGKVWLLNINKQSVTELLKLRSGYSLLNFCEKDGSLYWGDYGANPNYEKINIYRLDNNLNLSIAYSFPAGSIRHIHNIIKDDDGFIVLCGDNEPQSGIYRANADWSEVTPLRTGEQKYRAVVGYPHKGGLLYATDSVETENHLRLIESDGTERILTAINGSCIYGGETKDHYLFSTTVEPHEGGGIKKMLSNKLGGGIKSNDVHILAVSKKDLSIRIIKQYRKDFWPMKLFQYGRAPFAGGQQEATDGLWCYPIACVGTKGRSEYIKY